jgi:hypothetical protein
VCLDPVEDAGIVKGGEPSRVTAALDLDGGELVGLFMGEAAGGDGGDEAVPVEMADVDVNAAARRALRSGATITTTIIVVVIVVVAFLKTVDELGEVHRVVIVLDFLCDQGWGLKVMVVVFPGAASESCTSSAKDIAAEGEQMLARMVILPVLPDLDEMGGDGCLGVPTPCSEELGHELAAGEGVVPEEGEIMGDISERGGGEDVGLFLHLVIRHEGDAAGTVILATEKFTVRAVPFGEVVPFQGAEREALQAV